MNLLRPVALTLLVVGAATAQQAERLVQAVAAAHSIGNEPKGIAALEALLAEGLDVNAADSARWTALMEACLEGRPGIVDFLVARGADVNASQPKFGTPLMIASGVWIVRRRIENIEARGLPESWKDGQLAAPLGMARTLIEAGARVNVQRSDGRTALMNAAMIGWTDVVQLLLASDADVRLLDTEGRSAMDYVSTTRSAEIEKLLAAAGTPPRSGKSGRLICDAQLRLAELGHSSGIADCVAGDSLRKGLLSFQQAKNIGATGQLDRDAITALGL